MRSRRREEGPAASGRACGVSRRRAILLTLLPLLITPVIAADAALVFDGDIFAGEPPAPPFWLLPMGRLGIDADTLGTAALDAASWLLTAIVAVICIYCLRHLAFSANRVLGRQRHPYLDIDCADWPRITVFIAAHNEEKVVAGCIEALLRTSYPADRLKIVPVNDRSTDRTREIIDRYVQDAPDRIVPFHRTGGKAGKAAALKDALAFVDGDIVIVFDADYVPGRGLLKQLVAPFFDPEVGAVMGRVVPINAGTNLLTRLLDLERAGGYQVDQQARMNMRLVPQYGGTVGGMRLSAVEQIGGFRDDTLAEDTDMTYRLVCEGWKVVYSNRSECYEEVPEEWPVRLKQIMRWSKGHNQVLMRYWTRLVTSSHLSVRERIDGFLLLFVFAMPPLLLAGWVLALGLYLSSHGSMLAAMIPAYAFAAYGTQGNFAAFFEIAAAVVLDGNRRRLRLLPLNLLGFFVSLFSVSYASYRLLVDSLLHREMVWDKTVRYRQSAPAGVTAGVTVAATAAVTAGVTTSVASGVTAGVTAAVAAAVAASSQPGAAS